MTGPAKVTQASVENYLNTAFQKLAAPSLRKVGTVPKSHQWMWSNAIASVLSSFAGLIFGLAMTRQFLGWDVALDQIADLSTFGFLGYMTLAWAFVLSWFFFHGLTGLTMARLLAKVPLQDK